MFGTHVCTICHWLPYQKQRAEIGACRKFIWLTKGKYGLFWSFEIQRLIQGCCLTKHLRVSKIVPGLAVNANWTYNDFTMHTSVQHDLLAPKVKSEERCTRWPCTMVVAARHHACALHKLYISKISKCLLLLNCCNLENHKLTKVTKMAFPFPWCAKWHVYGALSAPTWDRNAGTSTKRHTSLHHKMALRQLWAIFSTRILI